MPQSGRRPHHQSPQIDNARTMSASPLTSEVSLHCEEPKFEGADSAFSEAGSLCCGVGTDNARYRNPFRRATESAVLDLLVHHCLPPDKKSFWNFADNRRRLGDGYRGDTRKVLDHPTPVVRDERCGWLGISGLIMLWDVRKLLLVASAPCDQPAASGERQGPSPVGQTLRPRMLTWPWRG
jgi:hypothetical protein